jgi:hypothetical protein
VVVSSPDQQLTAEDIHAWLRRGSENAFAELATSEPREFLVSGQLLPEDDPQENDS